MLKKDIRIQQGTLQRGSIYLPLLSYISIAALMFASLWLLPKPEGYRWLPLAVNSLTTFFFMLLVLLTARLAHLDRTGLGVWLTAIFLLLFCPGADKFFLRDEHGLLELASQCMVPFFFGQYTRLRHNDFSLWYILMFLMGIFCSYTHNGVTIPLCATFLWISLFHLKGFFRMACWPMVIGFVIGTTLSIYTRGYITLLPPDELVPWTIRQVPNNIRYTLNLLWDTKVFVIAVIVTAHLFTRRSGRRILQRIARRHYALTLCMVFSLLSLPFAPLGIENAVTGVCFFCMFWLLFIVKYLDERYGKHRI